MNSVAFIWVSDWYHFCQSLPNCTGTALKLHWSCTEAALESIKYDAIHPFLKCIGKRLEVNFHWSNHTGTALEPLWNRTGTALGYHTWTGPNIKAPTYSYLNLSATGTALKLHWDCPETAPKLPWNRTEAAINLKRLQPNHPNTITSSINLQ